MEVNEYLVQGNLLLRRGSYLRIDDGREMCIHVWSGGVWITQEDDRRDVFLKPGDWFRIDRRGRTVVSALKGSAIALTSPYEEGSANRIDLVRAGTEAPMTVYAPALGRHRAIATLKTRFMRTWVGLFAPLVRRPGPAL